MFRKQTMQNVVKIVVPGMGILHDVLSDYSLNLNFQLKDR